MRFLSTGDDIAAYLGPKIEGGKPPDVAILPQPGVLQTFAADGDLIPIEDFAGEVVDENFAPGAREVGTVDDTLYAVWFRAAQKSTVWYNTHVFEDAGVEPPATWDELLAAGRRSRTSACPRTRSASTSAGPCPTCSRTSTCARPGPRCTTSWPSTRSPGPTRRSPTP